MPGPVRGIFVIKTAVSPWKYENILPYCWDTDHVYVIPTRNAQNQYRILVTYSSEKFDETLESLQAQIGKAIEAHYPKVVSKTDSCTTVPQR